MKLGQLIHIVMGNISWQNFTWFGGMGPKSRPVLIHQLTAINQTLIITVMLIFFKSFEDVN